MSEKRAYTIYALIDPRVAPDTPQAVFYVGQTTRPKARLWGHIKRAERDQQRTEPCIQYIRSILADGLKPQLSELEKGVGDDTTRKDAENRWIAHYQAQGSPLQNAQEGGRFGYQHSEATRAKMSRALQATKRTAEYREKQSRIGRELWSNPDKYPTLIEATRLSAAKRAGFDSPEALAERDAEILALYEAGAERGELAKRFGIKPGDVGNAIKRARKRANEPHVDRQARLEARRALRTHCRNGHPWNEQTIRWDSCVNAWRCMICEKATKRRWEEKNKGSRRSKGKQNEAGP
jgi:DNA-binding CsgD family transcriptional regulator